MDPISYKYVEISGYSYVLNNPIKHIDPDGMRVSIVGDDNYKKQIFNALINLALSSEAGAYLVNEAFASDNNLVIGNTMQEIDNEIDEFNSEERGYSTLAFNLENASKDLDSANGRNGKSLGQTVETNLAHEIGHFVSPQTGYLLSEAGYRTETSAEEVYAVEIENRIRRGMKMLERTHYNGINVYGKEIIESNNKGFFNLKIKKDYSSIDKGEAFKTPIKLTISSLKDYYFKTQRLRNYLQKPINTEVWTISN